MAQISSSTGLISGINYGDIINQLIAIEQQPVNNLQSRINNLSNQKTAFIDLTARLTSLQIVGTTLEKPSTFQAATTTSSNPNVLTATASNGAAIGTYQFQVAQLVSTQQSISQGYSDPNNAKLSPGTLSFELGGGELSQTNDLSDLRGGAGVSRGVFKITDRSGATATIDTTSAVSLKDIVNDINTNLDISVKASIVNDHLVLQDETGKTASDLVVRDVGDGTAAADLGIVADSTSGTITGTDINYLGPATGLSQINDGRGITTASTGDDFQATLSDGTNVSVSLAGAKTIGDVLTAINTAGAGKLTASVVPGANGITLSDSSGGGGTFQVTALNGSQAAQQLGILQTGTGGTITGSPVLASLGSVLVSSLNGGQGYTLGTIAIQSRGAISATQINLTGDTSVSDIIDSINTAGAGVKASLNSGGDGIQIVDTSGGSGNLVISDASGTTAADFGLAGTYNTTVSAVKGKNLDRAWVSANTLLSSYNGGQGVGAGSFTLTASNGTSASIDISKAITIGDVINDINARGIGVTASINSTGDGLLLTDTAGGSQAMKVVDDGGTAAKDLNIAGTATGTTINGSETKTITVTANDTLTTLQQKINNLGAGVNATIINDGSSTSPYRLSINAKNSGLDGRVVIDDGTTGLNMQTLVEAQDAAVFVGGSSGSSQPLLVTSSSNQITGIVQGVNISLVGTSDAPVTLSVTNDIDNVVNQMDTFTNGFNTMINEINTLTAWDATNNTGGLLMGDSTVQDIQSEMYNMLNTVNPAGGKYRIFADIGLTIGDNAQVKFDEDKFRAAYAADPDAVQQLFTSIQTSTQDDGTTKTTSTGLGYAIDNAVKNLTDPVNGTITMENNTLTQRSQDFQNNIDELNALIEQKRNRLEEQFANLETTLASLQQQQQAIGSITSIKAPAASSSKAA